MKTKKIHLSALLLLMTVLSNHLLFGQATTVSATNTPVASTDYLGWSTTNDLDFKTQGTLYMRLLGTGGNPGFFGIGQSIAASNPLFQLDVDDDK